MTREPDVNVVGGELLPCSIDPMTGFYREGCCSTGAEDLGSHTVCVVLTEEFLEFSAAAGNDLSTPRPEWGFAGLAAGRPLVPVRFAVARCLRGRLRARGRARCDARARPRDHPGRGAHLARRGARRGVSPTGWVALLRGINVGGRNSVPMAELRRVLEANGAEAVSTYIQSGNVVFRHEVGDRAALARKLEAAVKDAFDVPAAVVLRTFREIAKVASATPFGDDNSKTHVVFLAEKPAAKAVRELASLDLEPDRVAVVGSDVFLHYPNGITGARLSSAQLERKLGVAGTGRNWRTVTRLAAMADEA